MSLNIKMEPLDSSVSVDVSSDDDDLPKVEIPTNIRPERARTPDTHCSICLEELNNKSHSNSCWHMFCFECLKRWSTIESSCPLCKKTFNVIYHTFIDQGVHETYQVPAQEQIMTPRIFLRPIDELAADVNGYLRMNFIMDIVRRNERLFNTYNSLTDINYNRNTNFRSTSHVNNQRNFVEVNGSSVFVPEIRTRIYVDNMWAEPLPDITGRYRDCSSAFFRENPAQRHRLHRFVIRDITAIRSISSINLELIDYVTPESIITNLILQSILSMDIRCATMTTLLLPYLGQHTVHFCHELYNFANSPYDMHGYDRNVRYTTRQNYVPVYERIDLDVPMPDIHESIPILTIPLNTLAQNETIVLDSDSDETIDSHVEPVTIVLSSTSSDSDSDIEVIHSSFITHTIEDSDSSRDQPSTSTGIRDSLVRPNNRYNLRRRRYTASQSTSLPGYRENNMYPSREERIVLDSSSEDEGSRSRTRNSQTVHSKTEVVCGRKKKKIKKSHARKRRRNVDESQPVTRINSRSRTYSGSSSSGDTDTRSNNNNLSVTLSVVNTNAA